MIDSDRLIEARKVRGLSQTDLARLSGVTAPMICRIERGETPGATIRTLLRLADTLYCSTDYLLGRGEWVTVTDLQVARDTIRDAAQISVVREE